LHGSFCLATVQKIIVYFMQMSISCDTVSLCSSTETKNYKPSVTKQTLKHEEIITVMAGEINNQNITLHGSHSL
jgi:hypothetical protein